MKAGGVEVEEEPVKSGLRPTHELKIKDPETGRHTTIGVAWDANGEWMNIQLNPGVSISYVDQQQLGLKLTIFKKEEYKESYE